MRTDEIVEILKRIRDEKIKHREDINPDAPDGIVLRAFDYEDIQALTMAINMISCLR